MRDPTKPVRSAFGRALVAGVLTLLSGCGPSPAPTPQQGRELVAIVRPGPASWFPGPDGELVGFDHDLLTRFAHEQSLPLRVITTGSASELLALLAAGKAHVGAGGLFQAAPAREGSQGKDDPSERVRWTTGNFAVEPVLIYNVDGYRPRNIADLESATVAYPEG